MEEMPASPNQGRPETTRERWPLMTAYERFEQIVALALSLIIAVVIVIALSSCSSDSCRSCSAARSTPWITRCSRPCSA